MPKQTLFEISEDFRVLDDLLEEADIESPEVQQYLAQWSDELRNNLEDKVDNYAAYITTLLARAEARKAEAKRLAERAKSDENKAKALKDNLKRMLEVMKVKTVDTARFKVTVATAGGRQAIECNVLPEDLPKQFQKIVVEQDSKALYEVLSAGKEVAGCRLLPRSTYLKVS